jgi:hypothetical protein
MRHLLLHRLPCLCALLHVLRARGLIMRMQHVIGTMGLPISHCA